MNQISYPVVDKIYALNGDGWALPASTIESFWSALGAGANGLVLNLFLTKDEVLVCAPDANLQSSCGCRYRHPRTDADPIANLRCR